MWKLKNPGTFDLEFQLLVAGMALDNTDGFLGVLNSLEDCNEITDPEVLKLRTFYWRIQEAPAWFTPLCELLSELTLEMANRMNSRLIDGLYAGYYGVVPSPLPQDVLEPPSNIGVMFGRIIDCGFYRETLEYLLSRFPNMDLTDLLYLAGSNPPQLDYLLRRAPHQTVKTISEYVSAQGIDMDDSPPLITVVCQPGNLAALRVLYRFFQETETKELLEEHLFHALISTAFRYRNLEDPGKKNSGDEKNPRGKEEKDDESLRFLLERILEDQLDFIFLDLVEVKDNPFSTWKLLFEFADRLNLWEPLHDRLEEGYERLITQPEILRLFFEHDLIPHPDGDFSEDNPPHGLPQLTHANTDITVGKIMETASATRGCLQTVQLALEYGGGLDGSVYTGSNGPAIFHAFQTGDAETVILLLNYGISLGRDPDFMEYLHEVEDLTDLTEKLKAIYGCRQMKLDQRVIRELCIQYLRSTEAEAGYWNPKASRQWASDGTAPALGGPEVISKTTKIAEALKETLGYLFGLATEQQKRKEERGKGAEERAKPTEERKQIGWGLDQICEWDPSYLLVVLLEYLPYATESAREWLLDQLAAAGADPATVTAARSEPAEKRSR